MTAVEVIAEALLAEGAAPGSSLHSWRCEYPDRYGPCDCVQETADVVLAVVGPELDRLRAEVVNLTDAYENERRAHLSATESVALSMRWARSAEAERDVLRARLAKVEALCWRESRHADVHKDKCLLTVGQVRAALASVPEPSDSGCEHMGWGLPVAQRCVKCGEVIPGEPSDSEPTEAEKIVARFDAMTQEEHEAGIAAARERAAERDSEPAPDADREAGER